MGCVMDSHVVASSKAPRNVDVGLVLLSCDAVDTSIIAHRISIPHGITAFVLD